jgi:two-component system cell cycle sensor histidine kinase/response regulator CckA
VKTTFNAGEEERRPLLYLGLSGVVLLCTLLVPVPGLTALSLGGASGLLALACILFAQRFWLRLRPLTARSALNRALHAAPFPALLSDERGRVVSCNAVFQSDATFQEDRTVGPCFARVAASPDDVVQRLLERVEISGEASEIVGLGERTKVSVAQLAPGRLLWTFAPAPDEPEDHFAYVDTTILAKPGLLDALPVPMLKIAQDGALLEANGQARTILSIEGDDLPPLFELVEGMGRPIADWLNDAADGRGLLKPEIVRAVLPTQELYLQIALGRVVEDNVPVLIGILNDATELKTLEAQFVQSQKMQAIGQLAGGVAHDFNNLLTAISGHCDLLLLRHDAGDPDYADLIQIAQNANRAASLVGQLLAFSRKQNLKPQSLDIRDTMSDLAHLLNRLIGEKITLEVNHAPGAQTIRADRRQLEQVIVNLVVNARDALPEGGKITVLSDLQSLDEELVRDRARVPPGDYVRIRVIDGGVGIPQEGISKIFEPFYSTKKTGEGTGLGLSTAYGIVKQTGGYIFVDSRVGEGTQFSLYFPFCHTIEAEPVEEAPVPQLQSSGDGIVLLVEDEAPVRAFASRALQLRGYTVIEAEDAEEALEILEDDGLHIDLFLSDVVMPGMDGPSWVRQAHKTRPNTNVIFMSGYSEEGRVERQSRIPNSVFLPKPFSLHQLTSLVHEQLH